MITSPHVFDLPDAEATARFAERMGAILRPGDCLLLAGPIGAGKTHFSRHLIQSLLSRPESVPSPTFTLVQTYDTVAGPLWHADLYRLGAMDEIEELGLADAFDEAICLVEWPERLGPLAPRHALWLNLLPDAEDEDLRTVRLCWTDPKWAPALETIIDD